MRTVSMCFRLVLLLACGSVQAQTTIQGDCDGNECFAPEFDVGVVYQSPVGHYGITALMYAVELEDLARVESLLASGADVNARNDSGATALLMAAAYGSSEIVVQLLAAGANPDIGSHRGETPLGTAIRYRHSDIAVALLEHGANPTEAGLEKAAVLGQTSVVESILDLGAGTPESSLQALSLALWKRHEDIAALLLETNIDLNQPTYDAEQHGRMETGEFVLHTAAQQGLVSSTALLLEKGADVNRRSANGRSALYFAARENHAEIVLTLLDAGADVAADDVAVAIGTGNEATTQELLQSLDTSTLGIAELERLIVMADKANFTEFLERLFSARDSRVPSQPVTTLLFAKANAENCKLVQWDLASGRRQTVFSSAGQCEQSFFFNRPRSELYVLTENTVSVISLDAPGAEAQQIELPTAMIDENLAALRERVHVSYQDKVDSSWMTARVVQFGVLEGGEFAFVTHSDGPADEVYGYLYALSGGYWRVVRNEDCHRFDPCYFDEVLSHSLLDRPAKLTVWSPEIRRNPHFVDKTEEGVLDYEFSDRSGVITLRIDGQYSLLRYEMAESGHCAYDCVYASALSLELPDQDAVRLAESGGNSEIVDRYALVRTGSWPKSELIDLGTGESVLGELAVAGWIH